MTKYFLIIVLGYFAITHGDTPNVILIYTDDVGYGDVGFNGGLIPTPNLDKMAGEGLNFTDFHTTSSTCTPSRLALLTGIYPWRQAGSGIANPTAPLKISPDSYTLADLFKDAGYTTGVVGKWHLGLGGQGGPNYAGEVKPGPLEIGFDESFLLPSTGDRVPSVFVEGHRVVNADPDDPISIGGRSVLDIKNVTQYPVGVDNPASKTFYESNAGHSQTVINGIGRIGFMAGGKKALWKDEDIADDLVTRAKKFIGDHKSKPFFLYFSTHDIHVPRVPHPRFRGISGMSYRGDAMVQLDWCVGEIRKTLEAHGLDKNTLVIFSSDNGHELHDGYVDFAEDSLGNHNPGGPFRGGKYSVYEGGTVVPTFFWWPGKIEPRTSNAFLSQIDIFASFAHFFKKELPEDAARDSENHWSAFMGHTEKGKELLVVNGSGSNGKAIRVGYNKVMLDAEEAFDLKEDPGEKKNIYHSNKKMVDSLKSIYKKVETSSYSPPQPIIVGCMDSNYREYDDRVNVEDKRLCKVPLSTFAHIKKGNASVNMGFRSGKLQIVSPGKFNLSIYNLLGDKAVHYEGNGIQEFNLNNQFSPGNYLVIFKSEKHRILSRIPIGIE